ncbi:MAG: mannose-6-phosphate isomerase, class I [Deltaproteobacteria bacterium]|nr:mannose-6-phosphate isomerase, class I [Deltaproteobacteria bacterium]
MDVPWRMQNRIMNYPWGSRIAIARLLGFPEPSSAPQAELWMGDHPRAPSRVHMKGAWISLTEAIEHAPASILGPYVAKRFKNRLPFLFKVLAAEKPLSIQAHPDAQQARQGFERENALGIPLDAPHRNFRDDNPKPELLVALSPFWAMCGFRRIPEILNLGNRFAPAGLEKQLRDLQGRPDPSGLRDFFRYLMTFEDSRRKAVIQEAVSAALRADQADPVSRWISILSREYPDDIGVLSPVFLNLLQLEPGDGIFLSAGILHAYLEGVGVEVMANSLMEILEFREYIPDVSRPLPAGACEVRYETPAEEFSLSRIEVSPDAPCRFHDRNSVEILLCLDGAGSILHP